MPHIPTFALRYVSDTREMAVTRDGVVVEQFASLIRAYERKAELEREAAQAVRQSYVEVPAYRARRRRQEV